MRWVIYAPSVGEAIPDGAVAYSLNEPLAPDLPVVAVIVPETFTTTGTLYFDATDQSGAVVITKPLVGRPMRLAFLGWW